MNVFELDADLIARYEKFTRSFTSIRAEDLRSQIDAVYEGGKFWPEPLIGLNPEFKRGRSIAELARQGVVDRDLETVFSLGSPRTPISLHLHQEQALMKALQSRNYIVTTGTGSGKSLCFFVPIINRILAARRAGEPRRTRAIVIYPMPHYRAAPLGMVPRAADHRRLRAFSDRRFADAEVRACGGLCPGGIQRCRPLREFPRSASDNGHHGCGGAPCRRRRAD
ncbi:DEAD/DEAH box helicase [Erythrobacter sp. BLCC-B19]|uniref:DEAD/DEAH box helicase n=1 Tax=Erythrobacter sp. BLCC-B19 TaxID=3025315 RepID=UPI00235ED354|nr:DEAD/DEAH box helicase [Erythrobacter sp. BLCC-B19]WDA42678.1 DEAD/DEAH box helicase [Erythrobacter sp. BLCC-B19]